LTERFYSGHPDGKVTVRDGNEGTKRSLLGPRFAQPDPMADDSAQIRDVFEQQRLAYALIADALESELRAKAVHERFSHRVIALLPERWTMTRTRVVAYVARIESDENANARGNASR
jgi:Family of unknown function (DUF6166)